MSHIQEEITTQNLYPYQQKALQDILDFFDRSGDKGNLLFQLPTGGGKTIIFSHVAHQYIQKKEKKVLILTHRIELLHQTSSCLDGIGVSNYIINSDVKIVDDEENYQCFIAMVETLNNRLQQDHEFIKNIGSFGTPFDIVNEQ